MHNSDDCPNEVKFWEPPHRGDILAETQYRLCTTPIFRKLSLKSASPPQRRKNEENNRRRNVRGDMFFNMVSMCY